MLHHPKLLSWGIPLHFIRVIPNIEAPHSTIEILWTLWAKANHGTTCYTSGDANSATRCSTGSKAKPGTKEQLPPMPSTEPHVHDHLPSDVAPQRQRQRTFNVKRRRRLVSSCADPGFRPALKACNAPHMCMGSGTQTAFD